MDGLSGGSGLTKGTPVLLTVEQAYGSMETEEERDAKMNAAIQASLNKSKMPANTSQPIEVETKNVILAQLERQKQNILNEFRSKTLEEMIQISEQYRKDIADAKQGISVLEGFSVQNEITQKFKKEANAILIQKSQLLGWAETVISEKKEADFVCV